MGFCNLFYPGNKWVRVRFIAGILGMSYYRVTLEGNSYSL
jgi:hypothetical protein